MADQTPISPRRRTYVRFSISTRIQHVLMLVSFTTLAITGLAQKFALNPVSLTIAEIWGGVDNLRLTHHVAATVLMLVAIYHVLEVSYKVYVLHTRMTMLPNLQDLWDAWAVFGYNIGLGKSRPQMGRYTFEEKAEYWALIWGIIVMGVTGFMMWNPIITTRFLPGYVIPAAKAAHGGEAILAVLAIIVWHMYGVHLKRFNQAMWTGKLTETEMRHEHALELADLKAGAGRIKETPALRRRKRIYYPVAVLASVVMLFGVFEFVHGEQTALVTIPPEMAANQIYVPETPTPLPPTSTPTLAAIPTPASLTWGGASTLFQARCISCHSGPNASAGLDLNTYAGAMKGASDGPVIVAGNAAGSKLIQIQSGQHFAVFSTDELAFIQAWINAGAPEK
ncbi:MAG TPA: cytochrome b/b6 domain-containing protein [Anaerolineales bacterium]|nr:cytochrome b/b6 domain-containing protein [Anaerolineales bacterium]